MTRKRGNTGRIVITIGDSKFHSNIVSSYQKDGKLALEPQSDKRLNQARLTSH